MPARAHPRSTRPTSRSGKLERKQSASGFAARKKTRRSDRKSAPAAAPVEREVVAEPMQLVEPMETGCGPEVDVLALGDSSFSPAQEAVGAAGVSIQRLDSFSGCCGEIPGRSVEEAGTLPSSPSAGEKDRRPGILSSFTLPSSTPSLQLWLTMLSTMVAVLFLISIGLIAQAESLKSRLASVVPALSAPTSAQISSSPPASVSSLEVPAGAVFMYCGIVDPAACKALESEQYLICDGSVRFTEDYPGLAKALAGRFGNPPAGTPCETFVLPSFDSPPITTSAGSGEPAAQPACWIVRF